MTELIEQDAPGQLLEKVCQGPDDDAVFVEPDERPEQFPTDVIANPDDHLAHIVFGHQFHQPVDLPVPGRFDDSDEIVIPAQRWHEVGGEHRHGGLRADDCDAAADGSADDTAGGESQGDHQYD